MRTPCPRIHLIVFALLAVGARSPSVIEGKATPLPCAPLSSREELTRQRAATLPADRLPRNSMLDSKRATGVDTSADTVIDCGPTTRRGWENCVRTIRRIVALLPRRPQKVRVLDPRHATPELRARLQHVDGFAERGERVVCLNERGDALGHALSTSGVWDYVVAIVVWHEMAHLDGAPESEAQQAEEDLWEQFIVSRKVDGAEGLAYLRLLRKRREVPQAPSRIQSNRSRNAIRVVRSFGPSLNLRVEGSIPSRLTTFSEQFRCRRACPGQTDHQ